MNPPAKPGRSKLPEIALLVGSLVAGLLIAEAALRIFNVWTGTVPLSAQLYRRIDDPILKYELRPSSTVGLYTTNEHGFRDAPFRTPKPPGVFRILFLGDSIVYGLWVKSENTITEQLEQILRETDAQHEWEVCNLGVSGYNTEQEIETYRQKCGDLDGDLVILGWFVNDLVEASAELGALKQFDADKRAGIFSGRSEIFRYSKLAGFVRYRVFGKKLNWGQALTERVRPDGDAGEQVAHHLTGFARDAESARVLYPKLPDQIEQLRALCETGGARFALVIMPVLCEWESYPFRDLHARIVASCDSLGVPALDLLSTFEQFPLEQITTGDAAHPSAFGHRKAAEATAAFLAERSLLAAEDAPSRSVATRQPAAASHSTAR
jgi:lysophospholipase L1-like esterase